MKIVGALADRSHTYISYYFHSPDLLNNRNRHVVFFGSFVVYLRNLLSILAVTDKLEVLATCLIQSQKTVSVVGSVCVFNIHAH